jgi:DNA repair ATPase RecN
VKEFDLRRKIYERLVQNYTTVNQLRDLRAQLKDLEKRLHGDAAQKEIAAAGDALHKKLDAIEKEFINPKLQGTQDTLNFGNGIDAKYALLGAAVESTDMAPTESEYELFASLEKQFAGPLAHWKEITEKDVPALNALAQRSGLGAVALGSGKPEDEGDEDPD